MTVALYDKNNNYEISHCMISHNCEMSHCMINYKYEMSHCIIKTLHCIDVLDVMTAYGRLVIECV